MFYLYPVLRLNLSNFAYLSLSSSTVTMSWHYQLSTVRAVRFQGYVGNVENVVRGLTANADVRGARFIAP